MPPLKVRCSGWVELSCEEVGLCLWSCGWGAFFLLFFGVFCGEGWNNFEMAGQVFIDRFVEFCNLFWKVAGEHRTDWERSCFGWFFVSGWFCRSDYFSVFFLNNQENEYKKIHQFIKIYIFFVSDQQKSLVHWINAGFSAIFFRVSRITGLSCQALKIVDDLLELRECSDQVHARVWFWSYQLKHQGEHQGEHQGDFFLRSWWVF